MFADGVGVVFLHVVAPLSGDRAEVGPPTDRALDPAGERARLRVDVQLGHGAVFTQPRAVVRHHLMYVLYEERKNTLLAITDK